MLETTSPAFSLLPKVISLKEGDFFFDSLRQVSDWVKKNRPQKEGEGLLPGGGGCLLHSQTLSPFSLIPLFPFACE